LRKFHSLDVGYLKESLKVHHHDDKPSGGWSGTLSPLTLAIITSSRTDRQTIQDRRRAERIPEFMLVGSALNVTALSSAELSRDNKNYPIILTEYKTIG
jgi:hypothetical protein